MACQPWLASEALAAAAAGSDGRVLSQHAFDHLALRAEGARLDPELIGTDLEVLGAASLFSRRAGVDELKLVIDRDSGADAWLARRLEALVRRPVSTVALQDLPDPEALIAPNLG